MSMLPLLDPALVASFVPRPPQKVAVDRVMEAYGSHARAQVRMACGVGKTHVGILTAATAGAKRVVVAVPSLSLVDQTLRSWMPMLGRGAQTVAVCSADGLFTDVGVAVGPRVTTTNPSRIGFLLEQELPSLVVTTYASLPRLAAAVKACGAAIDLLVLDEAHHLTGHLRAGHRAALDDSALPAARRLAMTATPVIATQADQAGASGFDPFAATSTAVGAVTMDDEATFGPVAYLYSTRQAIEDGYLCDYEVMVVSRIDTPFNRERLPLAALAAAANEHGATRALSFHNWVADARAFTSLLNVSSHDTVRFVADTINGTTPTAKRREILTRLAGACGPSVVRVVTAAKCLREGVDICAVDAVLFAAPRSNTVEIVQAIGRALRVHPGKKRGVIVLPLLLPAGGVDDDEQLTASQFAHIWKVLRALNSHDPRISETLLRQPHPSTARDRRGRKNEARALPEWLHLVGGVDADTIMGRLISPENSQWETVFGSVRAAVEVCGSAHRIKATDVHDGHRIGDWVVAQRYNYHRGVLEPSRIDRLNELPGWTWRTESLLDHRVVDRLEEYAQESGSIRDAATGESVYPQVPGAPRLGRWLAKARLAHRNGSLESSVAERLESLPGWAWDPLTPAERAGVEALRSFVQWEGTAAVPPGHREGDVDLSQWLDRHGRSYLAKTLSPELHEEILAACPVNDKGDPLFAWDVPRLRFEAGVAATRQFSEAHDGLKGMRPTHVAMVDDLEVKVYQWCARVRWLYGRGELAAEQQAAVQQIPGWVWSLKENKTYGAPIDLPPGVPHGKSHTRAHFGCPCEQCGVAAQRFQNEHKQLQLRTLTAGWVATPDGAAHAIGLIRTHSWALPISVAAAACMPRTLLGALMSDPQSTRVPPWVATRLEQLTVEQVRKWHRDGTRGRSASRATEPGDRVAHQRALMRLRGAGWSDAQIGAALGYRGSATHATRTAPSASVVYALTELVSELGPGTPVPSWLPASHDASAEARRAAS